MAKKPTNSSARAGDKETENLSTLAQGAANAASTPSGVNGPDGTNSSDNPESEAAAGGAGNLASPAIRLEDLGKDNIDLLLAGGVLPFEADIAGNLRVATGRLVVDAAGEKTLDDLLAERGLGSFEQIAALADIGQALLDVLNADGDDELLQHWAKSETPADVVVELREMVRALQERLALKGVIADEGKRLFRLLSPVRHNNVRHKAGAPITLSYDEHAEMFAKKLVPAWEFGRDLD